MSFYVRNRADFLARAYARLDLAAPVTIAPVEYLRIDRRWREGVGRVERAEWETLPAEARAFDSEEDAWTAFDRTGYGLRADYEVVEL